MIIKAYHTIYRNVRYVTTASFTLKTKKCELEHGKMSKTV